MILNMTPHRITVIDPNSCVYDARTRSYKSESPMVLRTIEPEGTCPRVATEETRYADIDGIQCVGIRYGEIENLPEPRLGTFLIVSALVAVAGRKAGRDDLLVPAQLVRDSEGKIVGCLALAIE